MGRTAACVDHSIVDAIAKAYESPTHWDGLRCCRQFADGSVEETQLDYGEFVEGVVALTCFAEPNPYTHTHTLRVVLVPAVTVGAITLYDCADTSRCPAESRSSSATRSAASMP